MSSFERLKSVVGPGGYLEGSDIGPRYSQDLWGERYGVPALVLRPRTTAEVAEILRLCNQAGQPIVPQGGMTGLVSGGIADAHEVSLSTERMTDIEALDAASMTMTVQGGAILQTVQEHAEEHGYMFPLDIAARGSCTIGGAVATNAGGNRVLLYGMMRELVLGVEAVLADGTVIDSMNEIIKNNAGYDLKQLFIGTEGTLGIVTRAVLRLRPKPRSQVVAFGGVESFADAVALLQRLQDMLPGTLSAFEAIWDNAYSVVMDEGGTMKAPFSTRYPIYILAECLGPDPASDTERFENALERASDLFRDVVLSRSEKDARDLWAIREAVPGAILQWRPLFGYDISLPLLRMEPYLESITSQLRARWPAVRLFVFGHLGDGNLHIAVVTGEQGRAQKPFIDEIIYRTISEARGSISAEHGIGFQKRPYLRYSRTEEEIALMRVLKKTLDPMGILSPGRVFMPGDPDARES